MQKALTQTAIACFHPGEFIADTHLPGLRVVAGKGRKSFIYRCRDLAFAWWQISPPTHGIVSL